MNMMMKTCVLLLAVILAVSAVPRRTARDMEAAKGEDLFKRLLLNVLMDRSNEQQVEKRQRRQCQSDADCDGDPLEPDCVGYSSTMGRMGECTQNEERKRSNEQQVQKRQRKCQYDADCDALKPDCVGYSSTRWGECMQKRDVMNERGYNNPSFAAKDLFKRLLLDDLMDRSNEQQVEKRQRKCQYDADCDALKPDCVGYSSTSWRECMQKQDVMNERGYNNPSFANPEKCYWNTDCPGNENKCVNNVCQVDTSYSSYTAPTCNTYRDCDESRYCNGGICKLRLDI